MNENDYDTTAPADEHRDGNAFTRRRVIGGLAGAGLLSAGLIRFASAQATNATPEASPAATPTTGTGGTTTPGTAPTANATQAIQRATTAITAVTADRDAVASQVQTQTVDAVLAQATKVRDAAQSAASSDATQAIRLARVATATALAARRVLIASLTYAGLPSQQAQASRVLTEAHDLISRAGQQTPTVSGVDVAFYGTTAQTLYATAQDELSKKAYARAAATARAAAELASIPELLTARERRRRGAPGRRGGRGHSRDGGSGPGTPPGGDTFPDDGTGQDEPGTVPSTGF